MKNYVVDRWKAAGAGDQFGTVVYNRGFYAAMLAAEAVAQAQEIHGVRDITPAMMRDGMEALEITEARWLNWACQTLAHLSKSPVKTTVVRALALLHSGMHSQEMVSDF